MQVLKIYLLLFLIAIPKLFDEAFAYPIIGIRINEGAKYTNNRKVKVEIRSLKLSEKLVEAIQINTNPDFEGSSWIPYGTTENYILLPEGDGVKIIYVRLKDKSGNLSPAETAEIILDTHPPGNTGITINNGAKFTNDKQQRVKLMLRAHQAEKMQISDSESFHNAQWLPFDSTKQWALTPPGDGKKFVFARFSDKAGNISDPVVASIILDTKPPENFSISINEDNKFTRTNQVKLFVKADEAEKVRIIDRTGQSGTYDYEINHNNGMLIDWKLDSVQGLKMVRAYFMDEAKNITTNAAQDEIIFDAEGPAVPSVIINNGAEYTNNSDGIVQVKLLTRENPENLSLLISNNENFGDAEPVPFQTGIEKWQLQHNNDGKKRIFVQLIDEAGNHSETAAGEIILDRIKPVINKILINEGSKLTKDEKVHIKIDVEGAHKMQLGPDMKIFKSNNWLAFASEIPQFQLPVGDGEKKLFFRFQDQAGNISDTTIINILLDTTPPKGKIKVRNDRRFINTPVVDLKVDYDDALAMQVNNEPSFEKLKWQKVDSLIEDWQLSQEDGLKSIFLRLKDEAGNISPILNTRVMLDQKPPQNCRMLINNGADWFNRVDFKVTLLFSAKGVDSILISNNESFENSKWTKARPTVGWTLKGGGDGLKIVYAVFKDKAGNKSDIITDSIRVDTQAPVVNNFMINNGADFTNDPDGKVTLSFNVDKANYVFISNEPIEDPQNKSLEWQKYQENISWKLKDEEGVQTVYAIFKDFAENLTQVTNDHIILDRTPPLGARIFINNNKKSTNDPDVELRMIAKDASEMMISNSEKFDSAGWVSYSHTINWKLKGNEDGKKLVYAKFKDKTGNISEAIYDDILLDRQPPANPKVTIKNEGSGNEVTLQLSSENASSMIISNNAEFKNADWEDFKAEKNMKLNKEDITIYIKLKDDAGNESAIVSQKIKNGK